MGNDLLGRSQVQGPAAQFTSHWRQRALGVAVLPWCLAGWRNEGAFIPATPNRPPSSIRLLWLLLPLITAPFRPKPIAARHAGVSSFFFPHRHHQEASNPSDTGDIGRRRRFIKKVGGPSCGQPIDAATLTRCLPRVPRLLSGVRMPPRWCPIRRRLWSLGRVSGSRQEEAQHWPKGACVEGLLEMVIEIPDQVSQHGGSCWCWNHFLAAGVPVQTDLGRMRCLCHPSASRRCEARGHGEHHTFARRSPRRRLERHEEDGTHCGLRDGLVPPALQKAISPCQDVGVDSMSPCAPVSQPNPHDSANAPSHDGRHSCRGGDIGCQRRRCHRRCRRALDMS